MAARDQINVDWPSDDWFGTPPLVVACDQGHATVVAELLAAGANPDGIPECEVSPLDACDGELDGRHKLMVPPALTAGRERCKRMLESIRSAPHVCATVARGNATCLDLAATHPQQKIFFGSHGKHIAIWEVRQTFIGAPIRLLSKTRSHTVQNVPPGESDLAQISGKGRRAFRFRVCFSCNKWQTEFSAWSTPVFMPETDIIDMLQKIGLSSFTHALTQVDPINGCISVAELRNFSKEEIDRRLVELGSKMDFRQRRQLLQAIFNYERKTSVEPQETASLPASVQLQQFLAANELQRYEADMFCLADTLPQLIRAYRNFEELVEDLSEAIPLMKPAHRRILWSAILRVRRSEESTAAAEKQIAQYNSQYVV